MENDRINHRADINNARNSLETGIQKLDAGALFVLKSKGASHRPSYSSPLPPRYSACLLCLLFLIAGNKSAVFVYSFDGNEHFWIEETLQWLLGIL